MKKILITGANSYVGTNVEKWLMKEPDKYYIETLDMKDPNWKEFDFSRFDVVFHVAGIAHVSTKKSMKDLYFKVNRDLTIETAKKAKESGVRQFIFMSSMIVYNSSETRITHETKPNPDNFYGLSKLQAEEGILLLESFEFKICVIRPPMIYGPNSKGNFGKLIRISENIIIFPKYLNKRSILYIDNLSNIIKYVIDNLIFGYIYPQNLEYICTYEVVMQISKMIKRKIYFTRLFNPIITLTKNRVNIINKVFSDSYYEIEMSSLCNDFCVVNLKDSLLKIINENKKIDK